ncbi:helix-turn-helix domain-containing protein, partial [Pseudomonas aeruginosa]
MEWVEKIASYLVVQGRDVQLNRLKGMACESNNTVSLNGLPAHQKMLIAGFANFDLKQEQLSKLGTRLS